MSKVAASVTREEPLSTRRRRNIWGASWIAASNPTGKSTCNADCATNWPPYTLDPDETLKPTSDASGTVTMITRDDGTKQVAYNGWPLYYFKADKAAGDAKGQNIDAFGGIWLIANP